MEKYFFFQFLLLPLDKWVCRDVPNRNLQLVEQRTDKTDKDIHEKGTVRLTVEITSVEPSSVDEALQATAIRSIA